MTMLSRASAATVLLFVGVGPSLLQADVYSDAVLSHNPLAYWRLGDAGPTTAADFSGNGRTGTTNGAAPNVAFGQPSLVPSIPTNNAIQVTNNAQRIVVPGFNKFGAGSTGYTVEYFVNASALPNTFANIVGDGVGNFYLMNYLTPGGAIRPHYSSGGVVSIDSNPLTMGRRYHIATTWDQATGRGNIYIDGALSAFTNGAGTGAPTNTSNTVYIGRDDRTSATGTMLIDEAAIYNRALTSSQIQSHLVAAGFNRGVTKEFRTDGFGTFTTIANPSNTDYADASSGNGVTFTVVSGSLHPVGAATTVNLNDGIAVAAPANANTFLPNDGAANQVRVLVNLNQSATTSLLIDDITTFGTTTSDGERAYQDYTLYGSNDLIAPSTAGDPLAAGWSLISDVIAFPDDLTLLTNAEYGVNIDVGNNPYRFLLWVVDNHAAGLNGGSHYVEFDIQGVRTPEPTTWVLWGLLGVVGLAFVRRSRKTASR